MRGSVGNDVTDIGSAGDGSGKTKECEALPTARRRRRRKGRAGCMLSGVACYASSRVGPGAAVPQAPARAGMVSAGRTALCRALRARRAQRARRRRARTSGALG
jgi:hypothetical protein